MNPKGEYIEGTDVGAYPPAMAKSPKPVALADLLAALVAVHTELRQIRLELIAARRAA